MRQAQKVQATVGARLFEVNISVNDKCNRPCHAVATRNWLMCPV